MRIKPLDKKDSFAISPRVILCGSRTSDSNEEEALRKIIQTRMEAIPYNMTIVVGYDPVKRYPPGADRIVFQEATKMGFTVETHPAEWDRLGKGAGHARNNKMARLGALRCIAFWDGISSGTKDMIDRAGLHNIPVEVVPWTRGKKRNLGSTQSRSDDSPGD